MATIPTTSRARLDDRETPATVMPAHIRLLAQNSPLGFNAGDTNLYRSVGNDPTNSTDPMGLYLVITEDQKGKPIELFFGKDNVEYEPIPGKPGWFKVKLKEGA